MNENSPSIESVVFYFGIMIFLFVFSFTPRKIYETEVNVDLKNNYILIDNFIGTYSTGRGPKRIVKEDYNTYFLEKKIINW